MPKVSNTRAAIAGLASFVLACETHAPRTPELTDAQIEVIAAHPKVAAVAARLLREPDGTLTTKGITDATNA